MIDPHIHNPKSPKFHVCRYLRSIKNQIKNKVVLDIPAGNGVSTELLLELGARVEPFDLFPEYFILKDIECKRANLAETIPVKDSHADFVLCQEGVEHLSDQLGVFREFNRVLKAGGKLLLTTPSYSNLKAKLSYLLFECEYFNKRMPPNEFDSVWMADRSLTPELYMGHAFLVGVQKLRLLARLSGFTISKMHYMRTNKTSLALLPLLYPLILLSSFLTYTKALRKNGEPSKSGLRKVYKEQLLLNINPKLLLDEHTFIVFTKEGDGDRMWSGTGNTFRPFGKIM